MEYRLEFNPTKYPWHYNNQRRDNENTFGWQTIGYGSTNKLNLFTYSIDVLLKGKDAKSVGISYSHILDYWNRYQSFDEPILNNGINKNQINKVCDLTWRSERIKSVKTENAFDLWIENISKKSDDHLYFIKAGNYIKIGRSKNVTQRLNQLKTGIAEMPELLHIENNKGIIEHSIHTIFKDTRARDGCEWFLESKHLYDFIEFLRRGGKY